MHARAARPTRCTAQLRFHSRPPATPHLGPSLLRSPLAWQVTVFFGLQSLSFYAVLAWLPSIYREHGFSPAAAGFLLSVSGLVQIPIALVLPGLASRASQQVWYLVWRHRADRARARRDTVGPHGGALPVGDPRRRGPGRLLRAGPQPVCAAHPGGA
jgi:hypothetical protein